MTVPGTARGLRQRIPRPPLGLSSLSLDLSLRGNKAHLQSVTNIQRYCSWSGENCVQTSRLQPASILGSDSPEPRSMEGRCVQDRPLLDSGPCTPASAAPFFLQHFRNRRNEKDPSLIIPANRAGKLKMSCSCRLVILDSNSWTSEITKLGVTSAHPFWPPFLEKRNKKPAIFQESARGTYFDEISLLKLCRKWDASELKAGSDFSRQRAWLEIEMSPGCTRRGTLVLP